MRSACALLLAVSPLLGACAPTLTTPSTHAEASEVGLVFDEKGARVERGAVVGACAGADAVLIGEMHDHPAGLAYAAKLFEDVLASKPNAALALEFLERDAQPVVDRYLAGEVDRAAFVSGTKQKSASFDVGHGKMIDAAKLAHAPVVAANAPRAYVKLARVDGYDALRALPEEEQKLFVVPTELPGGAYRDAFASAMGAHEVPGHASPKVEPFYRAQVLWDASMADSVARTVEAGRSPVVLVVGRFHVESGGGLVQLLRKQAPAARVVTVVMLEHAADAKPGLASYQVVVGPSPDRH